MLNETLYIIGKSFHLLWSKKSRWPFVIIPILLGLMLYSAFFFATFNWVINTLHPYLVHQFGIEQWSNILKWIFLGISTLLSLFLLNWTFVLLVTLLASPFNDWLSHSIEKEIHDIAAINDEKYFLKNLIYFFANEFKKICFIAVLSIIAFIGSFIPLLLPLTIWLSFLLMSIQFSDYYWARHQFSFRNCIHSTLKNLIPFTLAGAFFFVIVNIPIINLIVPAWGTSYFTIFLTKKNNEKAQGNS